VFSSPVPRPLPTCLQFAAAAHHASAASLIRCVASYIWPSFYGVVWETGVTMITASVQGARPEMSFLRQQPIE